MSVHLRADGRSRRRARRAPVGWAHRDVRVNAQQESFWSDVKTEFYNRYNFVTRAEAIEAVSRWINTVCNTRRRHSSLGQISPVQFEMQYINAAQAA